MTTALEKVNGHAVDHSRVDHKGMAEADAIRARSAAEAEALRIEAEGKARAAEKLAEQEAEKQRIANERAAMKLEKDRAAHERHIAEQKRKTADERAAEEKAEKAAEEQAQTEAQEQAEQQRTETWWKWGARGIYAVGLIIAAPIQFLAFWDPTRKFMVAAPALLEGLALVLALGAAWAVAHKRDVAPYRVGIMIGAAIAATINLWHGLSDPTIGLNAGIIGALASIGGPVVLMAYEHGIAQKADGIPSFRERRAAEKAKRKADEEKARAKAERDAAAAKAAAEKQEREKAAAAEQQRKDEDREKDHPEVWKVARQLRSARGAAVVTEQIWGDAWYLVTGSKRVGIDADIEAAARAAQTRMKAAAELPILGDFAQVGSQKAPRAQKDPNAPDGRRFNGGTPPRRVAGDTQPYTSAAKREASREQTSKTAQSGK